MSAEPRQVCMCATPAIAVAVRAGECQGRVCAFRDISSQKETEAALAGAEARLQAADAERRLLTFSRRAPSREQTIELAAIVAGIEKMLRPLVGDDVRLTIEHGQSAWVHVDPGLIEQVIMNLAANARDAMVSGGELTITTGYAAVDRDGDDGVRAGRYAFCASPAPAAA